MKILPIRSSIKTCMQKMRQTGSMRQPKDTETRWEPGISRALLGTLLKLGSGSCGMIGERLAPMDEEELIQKYSYWGEHPLYRLWRWCLDITGGKTRLGYWKWVEQQLLWEVTEG